MASKRRVKRKRCTNKIRYASMDTALQQRKWMLRNATAGTKISAYPCPNCGGFHVGHQPSRVTQSIAARRQEMNRRG